MKRSTLIGSLVLCAIALGGAALVAHAQPGVPTQPAVDQCYLDNCKSNGKSISWCLACCILHCDGPGGATKCQDACTNYQPKETGDFNVIVGAMLTTATGSDEPSQKRMLAFVTSDDLRGPGVTLTQAVSLCYVYRQARTPAATLAVALASDRLVTAGMDQDTRQALQDLIFAAAEGAGRDDPRLRNMGLVAIGEAGLTYTTRGIFALADAYFTDTSPEIRQRALCVLQGID